MGNGVPGGYMAQGVIMREELFEAFMASSRYGTAEKNLINIVNSGGGRQWIERQLNVLPSSIQYPQFVTDGPITGSLEYRKSQDTMYREDYFRRLQFIQDSQYPLLDRLAMFWSNHFTVSHLNVRHARFTVPFEFEAIRPFMMGKFSDLCFSASTHVAMLMYLGNRVNYGPNSPFVRRRTHLGINENQARELLELHTVGRTGPYTQIDVEQLALIMTGWTIESVGNTVTTFRDDCHEPGVKTVLGKNYGGEGVSGADELRQVISDISRHRATADFIGLKFCKYMLSHRLKADSDVVKAVSDAFFQSGGDLMLMYRAFFAHPQAWGHLGRHMRNVRLPDDWIIAMIRIFDVGNLTEPENSVAKLITNYSFGGAFGQPYGRSPGPDGWPQEPGAWLVADTIFNRGRFAVDLGYMVSANVKQTESGFEAASSIVEQFLPLRISERAEEVIKQAETPEQAMSLVVLAPQFERRA